jgi:PPOX class probable F420-dependent enzyme
VIESRDNNYIRSLVNDARVARLATIDFTDIKPHIVPVVFVFDGDSYYIPIDEKPKTDPKQLRRIRNIQANPNVALLIDEYNEDWSKLLFVMIQGKGSLIGKLVENDHIGEEMESEMARKPQTEYLQQQEMKCNGRKPRYLLKNAQKLLLEKYPQYQKIGMGRVCIMISPEKVITWKMDNSYVG